MATGMRRLRFRSGDVQGLSMGLATSLAPDPGETPEQSARRYLSLLFGAPEVPAMSLSATAPSSAPDLEHEETVEQPLTDTVQVSYIQRFHRVPVHGTRVGVEMTRNQEFVGVDGQVADVHGVDTLPKLSPAQARERLESLAGDVPGDLQPSGLVVRWDEVRSRWALAYVFEDVRIRHTPGAPTAGLPARHVLQERRYRVFIDAHSGEEVVRIPLFRHTAEQGRGVDGSGRTHSLRVRKDPDNPVFVLEDPVRKIRTCSLGYQSFYTMPSPLPGKPVTSATSQFEHPAAVAAHAHAATVYDYFDEVLKRRGIGGADRWIHSAVECVEESGAGPTWENAVWLRSQHPSLPEAVHDGMMLYGQVPLADGQYLSVAEGLDVVAHELTHGITDYTARLEYVTQSGALNESYSDIFGALIANHGKPIAGWKWSFGDVLNGGAKAIRDLSRPAEHGQPEHMSGFRGLAQGVLPGEFNDFGYVHDNSGIHNKAAYNLLTSGVFSAEEAARLFYLTLTTPGRLSPTATFTDAREGLVASCETLFRKLPRQELQRRIEAIVQAFQGVGL